MENESAIVRIEHLDFMREDRKIFNDISLSIPRGKITAIMGPSGSGKTTLLRLMTAQLTPDKGHVYINDTDIHSLDRKRLYAMRRHMGMLFQAGGLFTEMTVFENVAFPLKEHTTLSPDMIRDLVYMKLEMVGLRGARHLKPNELSGGMARRVAMARALALDPELMMYDEPFAGQDPITMGVLVQLIKRLNDTLGLTSVVVSHDVDEVTSIADYVYIISSHGTICAQGTPEAIRENDKPEVRQFIHGLADGVVPFHFPADHYLEELLHV